MPDMTAAQLLAQQLCTAACLLAASPCPACGCPCNGLWHGALAHIRVPETATHRRPAEAPQAGPPLIDRAGQVVDLDQAHREMDELEQLAAEQLEVAPA